MIFTNWDPLEQCIVGDCATQSNLSPALDLILEETKADLDNLANYLHRLGVEVLRPRPRTFHALDFTEFKIALPTQPIVPRDQYFVYGTTVYQTYTSMPDRYADAYAYYDVFASLFKQGYNWLSMPPPLIKNFDVNDRWYTAGGRIYGQELKDRLLWHTATMYKCGDALITNTKGPGTQLGLDWMRRNIDARIVRNPGTLARNFGHIDHGFYMIDDETVVCLNRDWLPAVLKNKRCIDLSGKYTPFDYAAFAAATAGDKFTEPWLDRWLTEWRGYAQPVAFEANVLVVDSHNIIFSATQPEVFKELEKYGINCHVCEQRHGMFWEAGIHCLTLDTKRRGTKRKII